MLARLGSMADGGAADAGALQLLADGRYAVTGLIGEGSQGQTLEAVDKRDGRLVAIKRFQIRGAKSWKDVELAEREAKVLRTLNHPSLPSYVDYFEADGCLYLVMSKIEGKTLRQLSEAGQLTQEDVVRFLADLSETLDYLHARTPPVIHRDIKPSNVIRKPDGSFALVDFGSVRDSLKPEGGSTVVGTFGFMAPEQFQGRALPKSDLYAAGATALSVLTRLDPDELPHQGLAIDVHQALGGTTDPRLVSVLSALLNPNPDQRAERLSWLLQSHRLMPPKPGAAASTPPPPYGGQTWHEPGNPSTKEYRRGRRQARQAARGFAGEPDFERFREMHRLAQARYRRERNPRSYRFPVALMLNVLAVLAWALFNVMLPAILGLMSLVMGRSFRRAAVRVDQVGRDTRARLHHAADLVLRGERELISVKAEPAGRQRVRVETDGTAGHASGQTGNEAWDQAGQEDEQNERNDKNWRRSGSSR